MPTLMPSLFKYFITVGAMLFVGLIGLNAVLEPGGPGPRVVQDSPKAKLVRHDPRASLVERLREEEAAQKASGKAEANPLHSATTGTSPVSTAASATQPVAPVRATVTQAAAVAQPQPAKPTVAEPPVAPAQIAAEGPAAEQRSVPAALTGLPTDDEARANRVAEEKVASEKARKKRAPRERARAKAVEEASASRQQDRYYYGQRPAYAYAPPPRPFGPFGQSQGGFFGRGW